MKRYTYKVCGSTTGFKGLEEEVSAMLNDGWKPIGGIAFNAGYPYQAMAKIIDTEEKPTPKAADANTAMRKLDEIT